MNIELKDEDQRFIEERLRSGPFREPSDVVHHAFAVLRKMKDELDAEIIEGIESGPPAPLEADWKSRVRSDAAAKADALRRTLP